MANEKKGFEASDDKSWRANLKTLFDEFRHESLSDVRKADTYFDRVFMDNHAHVERVQGYLELALKDAVTHSHTIDSRTAIHVPVHDIAQDRQWNFIDELTAQLTAKTGLQQDAIATVLVDVIAGLVKKEE